MKKTIRHLLSMTLNLFGFRSGAGLALGAFWQDVRNKDVPLKTKIWAWRRGFTGTRVVLHGHDNSNCHVHVPDADYYKLHPINNRYTRWIDDKLTMKYILAPFNDFLPKYYYQIEDEVYRLMDCPLGFEGSPTGIMNLLTEVQNLACKPIAGSMGEGFYRLTYNSSEAKYLINESPITREDLSGLLQHLKGYVVTEYIIAHEEIRKRYEHTPNTVRPCLVKWCKVSCYPTSLS